MSSWFALSLQSSILANQHGQAHSKKLSHPSLFNTGDTGSERTECEFVPNGTPQAWWEGREDQLLVLLFASCQFWIFLDITFNIDLNKTSLHLTLTSIPPNVHFLSRSSASLLVIFLYLPHFTSHCTIPPNSTLLVPLSN